MKSVIVPSVQSPPSMLKLHDFCNRAVYSKARIPAPYALARSHVLLGDDLTANLLSLEELIRQAPARPVVLELDAADEMLFAIARTSVATHGPRAGTAAQAAAV
ncbi:hypothetical protein [Ochrobactrum sp. AP1BH01-1]|uniref:hypothetical protein n=1 Tax=Ochrobactrum sp. AP1BH01-1 TaxID=2823874 RepID=UPI001B373AB2|nr:hypothetical protein [Ochrobactrum sp. AP1BH01-1]MBQ0711309.1 hypothetical protein [Ochrobactrum sp. AP1BH01-1]